MSRLRARCPECGTLTAVAVDEGYECHACGRAFAAGLVRVPRAWGAGGEQMAEAAWTPLPYPEVAVVEAGTLGQQTDEIAAALPVRPVVLGGCCCAHVGAIAGLARRGWRVAVVWLDAHGDLNTPETSPSGNEWGMPLRAAIEASFVRADDVALVGARNLDPPEREYMTSVGIDDDVERALAGSDALYVAFDADVLDPSQVACFVPEPDGLSPAAAEAVLRDLAGRMPVAGVGLTGLVPGAGNEALLAGLLAAAGF